MRRSSWFFATVAALGISGGSLEAAAPAVGGGAKAGGGAAAGAGATGAAASGTAGASAGAAGAAQSNVGATQGSGGQGVQSSANFGLGVGGSNAGKFGFGPGLGGRIKWCRGSQWASWRRRPTGSAARAGVGTANSVFNANNQAGGAAGTSSSPTGTTPSTNSAIGTTPSGVSAPGINTTGTQPGNAAGSTANRATGTGNGTAGTGVTGAGTNANAGINAAGINAGAGTNASSYSTGARSQAGTPTQKAVSGTSPLGAGQVGNNIFSGPQASNLSGQTATGTSATGTGANLNNLGSSGASTIGTGNLGFTGANTPASAQRISVLAAPIRRGSERLLRTPPAAPQQVPERPGPAPLAQAPERQTRRRQEPAAWVRRRMRLAQRAVLRHPARRLANLLARTRQPVPLAPPAPQRLAPPRERLVALAPRRPARPLARGRAVAARRLPARRAGLSSHAGLGGRQFAGRFFLEILPALNC